MNNFWNNPIVHGLVAFITFGIGFVLSSGQPFLALTIGAVLKGFYTWLVAV